MLGHTYNNVYLCSVKTLNRKMKRYRYIKSNAFTTGASLVLIFSKQTADTDAFAHTRVFAPKFGYLEDPATGSGNSAFANYLLSENLWNGAPITIEQGGNDRIFNSVKVKYSDGQVLFGGKSTIRIEGDYYICNNYDE